MGNQVFANGREVSCKAAAGKSICAFPDVCMTPPETPVTPPGVPIPYPNTGMSSDATGGSKKVKVSDKEVMLKNKSYFKTSVGDEAGCAAKKGVVTSKTKGKIYFNSWSMDVKIEGANVVRHLDLTTHNHGSLPCNTPPWMHTDSQYLSTIPEDCHKDFEKARTACRDELGSKVPNRCDDACKKAQACVLVRKKNDKKQCCKGSSTGHHMIEDQWVKQNDSFPNYISFRVKPKPPAPTAADRARGVETEHDAPTVCVNTYRSVGTPHRRMHDIQGVFEESFMPGGQNHDPSKPNGGWTYGEAKNAAITAHQKVFKDSNCNKRCLEKQLDAFYGTDNNRPMNPPATQGVGSQRAPTIAELGGDLGRSSLGGPGF